MSRKLLLDCFYGFRTVSGHNLRASPFLPAPGVHYSSVILQSGLYGKTYVRPDYSSCLHLRALPNTCVLLQGIFANYGIKIKKIEIHQNFRNSLVALLILKVVNNKKTVGRYQVHQFPPACLTISVLPDMKGPHIRHVAGVGMLMEMPPFNISKQGD
ncbi:unnamed protein product [Allacma fusca]|uniref:Uncharacterized protein n=1 Tax=Allacma fusca TaxID=39272 RepID=A0A8J2KK74_9HEXA|nr:unnamed protein product [Allacma fusca]